MTAAHSNHTSCESKSSQNEPVPSSVHGMIVTDASRRIIYADSLAKKLLGTDPTGRPCADFLQFFACASSECNDCSVPCTLLLKNHPENVYTNNFNNIKTESRIIKLVNGPQSIVINLLTISHTLHRSDPGSELTEAKVSSLIVGKHPSMEKLTELVSIVAKTDATVHIYGENGTGKELVAQSIHDQSYRASGPLVKLNCATIPATLLESTLFGHIKGSFTGAQKDQPGFIESAENGTLFLDEIADISPTVQLKLLRFLQSREYSRVGETESRKANVRIITASNQDLMQLVNAGTIREDFYYRIHVFPLTVPALRERISDIPLLTEYIVDKLNRRYNRFVRGVSDEVLSLFEKHSWPGNIRELENAIEHAFVLVETGLISAAQLPPYLLHPTSSVKAARGAYSCTNSGNSTHKTAQQEREEIVAALTTTNGRKIEAAKLLGYSRVTLWKKIRRYHINAPRVVEVPQIITNVI